MGNALAPEWEPNAPDGGQRNNVYVLRNGRYEPAYYMPYIPQENEQNREDGKLMGVGEVVYE
jgi:hypothetical protein